MEDSSESTSYFKGVPFEIVFLEGTQRISAKDGNNTASSVMLIRRENDREHHEIRDLMVLTDPCPSIHPIEIHGIGKVNAEGNKISYSCSAFTSECELIGEPWKWTSCVGKSSLYDGKTATSTTKFHRAGMVQEQKITNQQGETELTVHEFQLVSQSAWETYRKWVLGGDS